jgi:hypothetical protein
MRGDYIDFISSYCDSWCERCQFTAHCSAYAVRIATQMCEGDFEAAIELAVGAPPPMNEAERKKRQQFLEELSDYEPTDVELAAVTREEAERDERLDESALATNSEIASMLVHQWLENHREQAVGSADADIVNAIDIASRDGLFIHVKLHRALDGRDRAMHGEGFDDHPIQNDWNGTAKIALISIVRSIHAWDVIACATGDSDARHIKELLTQLQQHVEQEFPDARKFIRPGFDAPPAS